MSKKKKENDFPVEWAFKIAQKYELSTDWLLTGQGSKILGPKPCTTMYHLELLQDFDQWLSTLIVDQPFRRDWAKGILLDAFPMFSEWLKRREEKESKNSKSPDKKIA